MITETDIRDFYDVVISGGGPTGLLLALLLSRKNISCLVVEQRRDITRHSRSIGIHPPSMFVLRKAGLDRAFMNSGVMIKRGHAMTDIRTHLGTVNFHCLPQPFQFVLANPQHSTERILEEAAIEASGVDLLKGATLADFRQYPDSVQTIITTSGQEYPTEARFLVGCDGKHSTVRQKAGIGFTGKAYSNRYVMGDFEDLTGLTPEAYIFTSKDGLVESFPLPGNIRRWVAEKNTETGEASPRMLAELISERIGTMPDVASNSMISNFSAESFLAKHLASGRIILAGDAAHIVSPIGGQGMNLGWLDADSLATGLDAVYNRGASAAIQLRHYNRIRRSRARRAIKRAEFNMMLAHKSRFPEVRNSILQLLLNPPFEQLLARRFTMAGLE